METKTPLSPSTRPFADWRVYAAAGVATLAATSAADASIIYSGVQDLQFGTHGGYRINGSFMLGGQKVGIFGEHANYVSYGGGSVFLGVNNARLFNSGGGGIENFHSGAAMGGALTASAGILRQVLRSSFGGERIQGNFVTGQTGFVGFKFNTGVNGGGEGWIRVKVEGDGTGLPDGLEVIDWAYNDAGGAISTGQTVDAVPEPGGKALALLALGSAGVLAWRKRRNAEGKMQSRVCETSERSEDNAEVQTGAEAA